MASSKVYFWHEDTNEVVWTPPPGSHPRTPQPVPAQSAAEPGSSEPDMEPKPAAEDVKMGLSDQTDAAAAEPWAQSQLEATAKQEEGELLPQLGAEPLPKPAAATIRCVAEKLTGEVASILGPLPPALNLLIAACR